MKIELSIDIEDAELICWMVRDWSLQHALAFPVRRKRLEEISVEIEDAINAAEAQESEAE